MTEALYGCLACSAPGLPGCRRAPPSPAGGGGSPRTLLEALLLQLASCLTQIRWPLTQPTAHTYPQQMKLKSSRVKWGRRMAGDFLNIIE